MFGRPFWMKTRLLSSVEAALVKVWLSFIATGDGWHHTGHSAKICAARKLDVGIIRHKPTNLRWTWGTKLTENSQVMRGSSPHCQEKRKQKISCKCSFFGSTVNVQIPVALMGSDFSEAGSGRWRVKACVTCYFGAHSNEEESWRS